MFTVKKIFLNIIRNKGRSLILTAFSFLTVFFTGIYFENLAQNQKLLNTLGERIPVTAAITNSTGDRQTGLDITQKRLELFLELGLKDCVVTAESYGNIGVSPVGTRTEPDAPPQEKEADPETGLGKPEKRVSVHLTGTNTAAAMDAWKPEFSQDQARIEEILSGDRGLCLLNESYMQERGMVCQAGDVLDVNLYRALYDEFDGVAGFAEITSSELVVAGFYQPALEHTLEAADIICPLAWLTEQYRLSGNDLLYSSAEGTVEQPLTLNELKSKAEQAKFPRIDIQSVGGRPGNALVIDDRFFIQTASQLKNSIHLLKLFMAPLLLLVAGISALVSFFAMCQRKQEVYLERCMGRKKVQTAAELVGENAVLSLMGGAAALAAMDQEAGIFTLAVYVGIQIIAAMVPAVRLSLENPMRIFKIE